MGIFPIVYCKCCKHCEKRMWKNIFSVRDFAKCHGSANNIKSIIPGILWSVDECEKNEQSKEKK